MITIPFGARFVMALLGLIAIAWGMVAQRDRLPQADGVTVHALPVSASSDILRSADATHDLRGLCEFTVPSHEHEEPGALRPEPQPLIAAPIQRLARLRTLPRTVAARRVATPSPRLCALRAVTRLVGVVELRL